MLADGVLGRGGSGAGRPQMARPVAAPSSPGACRFRLIGVGCPLRLQHPYQRRHDLVEVYDDEGLRPCRGRRHAIRQERRALPRPPSRHERIGASTLAEHDGVECELPQALQGVHC